MVLKKKQVESAKKFPSEFTLRELTRSDTAKRLGVDNIPTGEALENLKDTAWHLRDVRNLLAKENTWPSYSVYGDSITETTKVYNPIYVSSGYRSPQLNKHIPGSSDTSAHTLGYAADIKCPGFGTPYEIVAKIAASPLMDKIDQLIYEYGSWVHISFDPRKRGQVLTIDKNGVRHGLHR